MRVQTEDCSQSKTGRAAWRRAFECLVLVSLVSIAPWGAAVRAIGNLAVGTGIDPAGHTQRMVALLIGGLKYGAPRQGGRPA